MRFIPPQSDFIMTDWSTLKPVDFIFNTSGHARVKSREFSTLDIYFAVSEEIVWLPQNEKRTYRLNARPQMCPTIFSLAITLNFQGKIFYLLCILGKIGQFAPTKNRTLWLNARPKMWHSMSTLAMIFTFNFHAEFNWLYREKMVWLPWNEKWMSVGTPASVSAWLQVDSFSCFNQWFAASVAPSHNLNFSALEKWSPFWRLINFTGDPEPHGSWSCYSSLPVKLLNKYADMGTT